MPDLTRDLPVVANYGGGVNSTAMVIELLRRGERLDAVVFADTGGEHPDTYDYVQRFSGWLVASGGPPVTVTRYTSPTYGQEGLEANCLRTEHLPSIAYGFKACSMKFKRDAVNQWARDWLPANGADAAVKLIGYDYGEPRRWMGKPKTDGKLWKLRFPLVEWEIDRDACEEIILASGLCVPSKSACFFCPMSKPREVIQLASQRPDLYERALAIEDAARPFSGRIKGLGSYFSWREVVEADEAQMKLFDRAARNRDLPCGCWDGVDDA